MSIIGQAMQMVANQEIGCTTSNWLKRSANLLRRFRFHVERFKLTRTTKEKHEDHRLGLGASKRRLSLLRSKESSNGIAVRRMLDMIITNQMDRGKGAGHRQVNGGPDLEVRLAKLELSVKHNANLVGKSEKPLDAPRSESGTEQWELVSGNKPYNDQNGGGVGDGAGKSKTKSLEERVEGLEEKVGQLAEDVGRILRALHAARINVK